MDSGNQTLYIDKECNFQPRADIGVIAGKIKLMSHRFSLIWIEELSRWSASTLHK